ncbi:MAG: thioredoxin family protein [Actinomycetota bacterium]
MRLTLQFFDGCPNWHVARERLGEALRGFGRDEASVELQRVESEEDAERLSFRGSPTILIDGRDPFAVADAPVGFSCRVYVTDDGFDGSPSVAQLREVLAGR